MTTEPRLDILGAALADPSRCRILCELMDGRAFTNKELACAANVSPQTASAHLKQLETAGLTTSLRSGRHVYHRIAGEDVAGVLETFARLSPADHLSRSGRRDQAGSDALLARCCYSHVAGRLGVLMAARLAELNVLGMDGGVVSPGPRFRAFLDEIGVELQHAVRAGPVVRLCLDWTERRHHISGPLATTIMQESLRQEWLKRRRGSRALTITDNGYDAFDRLFGLCKDVIDPVGGGG